MSFKEEIVKVLNNAGDKEIIVVCDFDGTITTADSDVTMNGMAKFFGYESDFAKDRTALYEEYGKYLTEGDDMTRYKMQNKWWSAQMELFKKHNVAPDSYTNAGGKLNFMLRKDACDMLAFCDKNDIPVFIVSSGLGNMIIPLLAFSGNLSGNMRVIANFVRYDEDKPVSYTPVVTPMNKSAHLALELEPFENYHAVVFGNEQSDLGIIPADLCTTVLIEN
ncbi:MAG: haloacid dehalogenase-like hydrolase [Oscillospiraceae bacterium]|nr:haloacid dehalogenase-like hydrolase [Oscillospiraceae bacterium]